MIDISTAKMSVPSNVTSSLVLQVTNSDRKAIGGLDDPVDYNGHQVRFFSIYMYNLSVYEEYNIIIIIIFIYTYIYIRW